MFEQTGQLLWIKRTRSEITYTTYRHVHKDVNTINTRKGYISSK